MKTLSILLIAVVIGGCCATPETIIQRDTLTVYQQGESDTLTLFKIDTVYQGENVKYILRIDTVYRKAIVYRKPDTVYVPYADTVQVVRVVKEEASWLERQIWRGMIIVFCLALLVIIIRKAFGI